MIKQINPQNILISPFIAAKSRALSNTDNSDIIIIEQDDTETIGIALEYIDYNFGTPLLNRTCNIALEQQSADLAVYEEGVSGSGTFNSQSAVLNGDGTYQVLVYNTVKNLFYNTYNNPTEILGLEHIDFPLSHTLRNLSAQFRMFSIPQSVFGDKIQPNSVQLYDKLLDDNNTIFDDGNQNLIIGYNLFAKVQEVHTYPSGFNPQVVLQGAVSVSCPTFNTVYLTNPQSVYINPGDNAVFTVSGSGIILPIHYQWYSGSTALVDNFSLSSSISGTYSGSTGTSLYVYNVNVAYNGNAYYATAWNTSSAGATSSAAILHVIPPTFTRNPSAQSNWTTPAYLFPLLPDQNLFTASFTVSTSAGHNQITFQWYSGSTALTDNGRVTGSYVFSSSVSGSILQVNDLQFSDYANYYCSATDQAGTSYSSNALLTIWDNTISQSVIETLLINTPLLFGSTTTTLPYGEGTVTTFGSTLLTGSVVNNVFYGNGKETASVSIGFDSGKIFNVIVNAYGGNDTGSVSVGFDNGLLFNVLVPSYGGNDTGSVSVGFDNGLLTTTVGPYVILTETPATFGVSLLTGSVS